MFWYWQTVPTKRTYSSDGNQSKNRTFPFINTSFSCKCPLLGQAESGQLIAVSRPSLIRSSTYCFRHWKKTDRQIQHWPSSVSVSQLDEKKRKTNRPRTRVVGKQTLAYESQPDRYLWLSPQKKRQDYVLNMWRLLRSLKAKTAPNIFILTDQMTICDDTPTTFITLVHLPSICSVSLLSSAAFPAKGRQLYSAKDKPTVCSLARTMWQN